MTDYTKTTNFATKDALPSGNANKIVKGTEINTEFDNIATAVATKANTASPTFTGVVSFPDGSASDPSITNTGDTNVGLFFSAGDTLAFTAGGTSQFTMADGVIAPVTDSDVDLGTSSLYFKNAYIDSVTTTGNITIGGNLDVDGTLEFNSLSGTGTIAVTDILDQDDMSGDSATALATQQSIKAYVDAQQDTVDTFGEVLALSNTTAGTDIAVSTDDKVQFRDSAIYINSSADGQLDIVADTEIQIAATTIDINGAVALNGAVTGATNVTLSGELDAATGDFSGNVDIDGNLDVDGTTNLDAVDIDGATQIDATVSVGVDDTGYDVKFFGATSGKSLLWDESADSLIVTGTTTMTGNSTVSGTLGVTGVLTGTSLDISGNVDIDGTLEADAITVNGTALNTVIAGVTVTNASTAAVATTVTITDNESTDESNALIFTAGGDVDGGNLGLESDGTLTYNPSTGVVTATGFAGTLTGNVTGNVSGTAATVTGAAQSNITSLGTLTSLDISGDATVGDDLSLDSDAAVLNFGANSEIKVIHAHDSGLNFKHTATADDKPFTLTLQTGETDIAADDVLGVINFQAPDEATGTDAILVAAGIAAVSEGDFSASNNATKLSFRTGASETATEKMSLSSGGNLSFPDNGKVIFGAGDDLQIYHDGSHSYIKDAGAGDLILQAGNDLILQQPDGSTEYLRANEGAGVQIYHNGSQKFLTTSTGIDVTGTVTATGTSVFASLDISGDIDVDGTTNLDVVDIDGAVDMASTLQVDGAATFNSGVVVNESGVDADFRVESDGNANMLFVDGGNNRVGIGTSSPYKTLTVGNTDATSWITSGGSNVHLTMSPNGSAGAFIVRTGGTNGDPSTTTERMRIDSSGNVLVGKPSADNTTAGTTIYGATVPGAASFVRDGGNTLVLNRLTSDGEIVALRKDSTTVGSIGTFAGDLTIGDDDVGLRFDTGTGLIPWDLGANSTGGAATNGAIDIGAASARFKDLYLSGGVYLGGTAAANQLEAYETGTWTPTASLGTFGAAAGLYVKVGDLVTVFFAINTATESTSTDEIKIRSVPFTSVGTSVSSHHGHGSVSYLDRLTGLDITGCLIRSDEISLVRDNTTNLVKYSDASGSWSIRGTLTFKVA